MIETSQWFTDILEEYRKDPAFIAEAAKLDMLEKICKVHGPPTGVYRMLFLILEWRADKLIWRKR